MIYIVVALKAEAQAFVDAYKLKKSKLQNFILFSNATMKLIVSGMGVTNARLATQTLINNFDITDDDSYYNIGICAAKNSYAIGETLHIGSIMYEDTLYSFDEYKKTITCVDEAQDESRYDIADMESYGFYDAVLHNPAIKNYHIIKIVSDYFQPQSVTKEQAKMLLFHALKDIF
ncbi:MAG: hypothetical protein JXQ67_00560 [Campylobacterales bacterium]|nr:hypothetical protein [Campylobacterales bacterium]